MAYRPIEARAYRTDNKAPPLYKLLAYAGVFLGMACGPIWQYQSYTADRALSLIDNDNE